MSFARTGATEYHFWATFPWKPLFLSSKCSTVCWDSEGIDNGTQQNNDYMKGDAENVQINAK